VVAVVVPGVLVAMPAEQFLVPVVWDYNGQQVLEHITQVAVVVPHKVEVLGVLLD
jgi:hypothetical protein